MADFVQMRNWQQFWNDYIYEGQKAGLKNEEIRRNLIEAFRKEIFGLVMFRAKVEDLDDIPQTPENSEMLRNIFRQEQNKWKKLVQECKKHLATAMLIREDDLTLFDKPEEDDEGDTPAPPVPPRRPAPLCAPATRDGLDEDNLGIVQPEFGF